MPLLREPRRSVSSDSHSLASSSGTKRRFPLLSRKKTKNSELSRPSTSLPPASQKTGFRVHVQVKFEKPLVGSDHARDYEGSPKFVAKDKVCQALLSRLQHCSAELITRHDCNALDPLQKPHRDVKPLRYRITYRVERDGLCLVEKSLRSFQEYELTSDDAREVVAATDRIVGLFMLRHDPGFRWSEVSEPEPFNVESETVRPSTGRPQSTCCIPRSRFVNATQTFELIPGYSIELFLRSRCATRYPENRNAAIKIDSKQPTPLTLLAGEDLHTRVFNLLDDPVCSWKRKFDKKHKSCDGLEGSGGCQHVEDGAVDIMVKVRNNIGPDYNYFSHRIQTSKVLFSDPEGRDFDEFANQLKAKMERARDLADQTLRSLDDFTIKIRELRGTNWSVHEPLSFKLDPSTTYCRQTVEAIIERLQSGISHVLEGHEDALATMTAHKRGHLIYDGFLDGAGAPLDTVYEKYDNPETERKILEQKLRERICADIIMLCKDTCALDCSDRLPNLKAKGGDHKVALPSVPRPISLISVPTSVPESTPESVRGSVSESVPDSSASVRSDHTLSKKQAKQNLRAESQTSLTDVDLTRVPSGVEAAKRHGYMGDIYANEENMSEPPSTPSLVDTDSISPHASVLVTPQSSRNIPEDHSNQGLRIIDDGTRVIYQERSDADEIAQGSTEIHHFEDEEEEVPVTKGRPLEIPSEQLPPRSLNTREPGVPSTDATPTETPTNENAITPQESSPAEPDVKIVPEPIAEPPAESLAEGLLENSLADPKHDEKPRELHAETIPSTGAEDSKPIPDPSAKANVEPVLQDKPVESASKALPEVAVETPAQVATLSSEKEDEPVVDTLPHEGILEYVCQPASPVSSQGTPIAEVSERHRETPAQISDIPQNSVEEPLTAHHTNPADESHGTSQDDSWEIVEAGNVPDTTSAFSQLPKAVEASTKSEISFETDATDPVVANNLEKAQPSADSLEIAETSKIEPLVEAPPTQEEHEPIKLDDKTSPELQTRQENIAAPESIQDVKDAARDEEDAKGIVLEDFPKPPSEKSFAEEVTQDEPLKQAKEIPQEHAPRAVDDFVTRKSEDSAIDLKEQTQAPTMAEPKPTQQEDKPAAPSSEDSGVYMGEQNESTTVSTNDKSEPSDNLAVVVDKDAESQRQQATGAEEAVNEASLEKEAPKVEPVFEKVSTENTPTEENATREPSVGVPSIENPATSVASTSPVVPVASTPSELSVPPATVAVAENVSATSAELAEKKDPKLDEPQVNQFLKLAPEEQNPGTEPGSEPEIVEAIETPQETPIEEKKSTPPPSIPEHAVSAESRDAPIEEPSNTSANAPQPFPTPIEAIASAPIIGTIPEGTEAGSYFPPSYRTQQGSVPNLAQLDIPQVIPRPRRNTLLDRPKSIALTLEIDTDPFDREDGSPVEGRPMSALNSPRRYFQHQRQPSAGLYGFREQRLMAIGLRNSLLPYQYRSLRRDGGSDSRPGTSYSEH